MTRFVMYLRKEKTYSWDEDDIGRCQFNAEDDNDAKAFVATIVERMNRVYSRMNEPRNVSCNTIFRLTPNGYGDEKEKVVTGEEIKTLEGFSRIRSALEAFYPKEKRGRDCLMRLFTEWRPLRKKRMTTLD